MLHRAQGKEKVNGDQGLAVAMKLLELSMVTAHCGMCAMGSPLLNQRDLVTGKLIHWLELSEDPVSIRTPKVMPDLFNA